jgi:hypothetical protein
MPTAVTFTIGGTASTSAGSISSVVDDTTFGTDPTNSGTTSNWSFIYSIDSSNSSFSTFSILFTAYDNLANYGNDTFEFRYDNTDPTISQNSGFTFESSTYLYYDGSSNSGFYSDNMGGTANSFYVGGFASDVHSGLMDSMITDNTTFGGDNPNTGSTGIWSFEYEITSADSSNGNFTVAYTATDNVGNTATDDFSFIIDNTDPQLLFNAGSTTETSSYLYYDGSSQYGYYSDNMGSTAATFTVGGTADDSNSGLYTINDGTLFGGNPSRGGTLNSWIFDYDIVDTDSSYSNFTVTFTGTDLVGNTATDTFDFIIDNTNPTISSPLVENPNNSQFLYILPTGDYFFFSDNMDGNGVQLDISGTSGDAHSGLLNVSYTSHFGNSPAIDSPGSTWSATYSIHGTDSEQTGPETDIIITSTDKVGNQITAIVTFLKDNYDPEISISSLVENSPYLYNPTSALMYYSNNGGGARAFTVTILGQETHSNLDAGLKNSSFPDIYDTDGGFNSSVGTGDSHSLNWDHQYSFTPTVTANGSYSITVYDLVGNSESATLEVYKDDNDPVVNITSIFENSWLLYYNAGELFYSNDQTMNASFTLNITVNDGAGESGRASVNGSTAFGESPSSSVYISNSYYHLDYYINFGENDEGILLITGYDKVGNSATDSFTLTIDNNGPTSLSIDQVVGHASSEFLHYTGGVLYFSNTNPSLNEPFTIQVSGTDGASGLLNATGEDDLGETNVFDTSYTTNYELDYTISTGETADEGKIDIYFYDLCGNNNSISLTTTLDNNGPVSLVILSDVYDGNSIFLHYDVSDQVLYYSNDQPMSETFTIHVNATDFGGGLKNATGEDEFGETGIGTAVYTQYFELSYTISESESASDNNVTITIFDMCGNSNTIDFKTRIDNNGPQDGKISQFNDYGSNFIHLNNDSGSLTLYVSTLSTIDHKFTLTISYYEPVNEVGYNKTISGLYFGESYETTLNFVTYYLNVTDVVNNGSLNIWLFDRVNNSNIISLPIYVDLTNPTLVDTWYFDDHDSDFLHYNTSHFIFSDNMLSTQIMTIYGTGTDGVGGSGVDRVSYQAAFGTTPSTDLGTSWSVDYGIDSTDTENDTAPGTITITITDRVNNNYTFFVPYAADNHDPSGLSINNILEDLLTEYLHYVGLTTTLYYSNVRPDRGSRKFTILVDSADTGGSGLRYASFPNIDTGFSSGGSNNTHIGGQWQFSYLIDNPAVANFNGSVNVTVFDNVGNSENISFDLFHDNTPPQGLTLINILEISEFIYYNTGNEVFYYSNNQPMAESFTVQLTAIDSESGIYKANASEFGDIVTNDTYGGSGFELTFTINQDETSPTFTIRVWDNVENDEVFNLVTEVDITPPQDLNVITVSESPASDYLYYDGAKLFFSNDQSMSASFIIQVNGTDSGSGRQNATGELEFNDVGVVDTSYITYYELIYNIVENDDVSDGFITIWLFDNVGNSNSVDLECTKDNTAPFIAISTVVESSYYLHYDSTNVVLFYSNSIPSMNELLTIRITGSDPSGAGRLNATGEDEFGETNVGDSIYTSYYELFYFVEWNEIVPDNYITIQLFDRVGNSNSVNLECTLDNDAPDIVTLDSLSGVVTSDYLYYNGTHIFFSNDQVMSEPFSLLIDVLEYLSGVENVTGSYDFSETPTTSTNASGTFDLQYTVSQSETTDASDGNIQIYVWDRVGNLNSSLILPIVLDNDAPSAINVNDILEDENSDFLFYSGAFLYYSNQHFGQNEVFRVNITSLDVGSGLLRVDGSTDFADTPSDSSYLPQGYYLVNYSVGYDEEASGDQITFTVFDRVNNFDSVTLNLVKDNIAPSGITIQNLNETSVHIYYDISTPKLFYSNNQAMSDQVIITILAQDNGGGAGLLNLTGSSVFNDLLLDNTYDSGYDLTFTINEGESDTQIIFSVFDRVGNVNSSVILPLEIDNIAPTEPVLIDIDESSNYLYYNGVTFYYSNDQAMNDSFTIQLVTSDSGVGLLKANGSTDFGETPEDLTEDAGQYDLLYRVSQSDVASGNLVNITVLDLVGNVNFTILTCTTDNAAPTQPVITGISENSEYLDYGASTFYYSNDQPMSDIFTIQFTTTDAQSDILKATGSSDFGGETPEDTTYTTYYELSYTVSNGETAGIDNWVNVTVYDQVYNNNTYSLSCILDNVVPSGLTIDNVIEQVNAQFIYYDDGGEVLFFSNDQSMAETFTVVVSAVDSGSDLQKANASAFGDIISNSTYGPYELSFVVNQGESESSIIVRVWDNVGNSASISLNTQVDNLLPENLNIISVLESSDFLFYDNTNLYFSNDQIMNALLKIHIAGSDSGAGLKNATGDNEFGDINVGNSTYTTYYQIEYILIQNDDVSDGAVTIWLYDKVGNRNSINLICRKDNTAPVIGINSHSPKTWYNTGGGIDSLAGTVADNQSTYNSGLTNNSFSYSEYNWTSTSYIIQNALIEVNLVGSTWIENDELLSMRNANITFSITVWDRCNNSNSDSIQIWHDDAPPTIIYNDPTEGANTPSGSFYIPANESTTSFDIDFGVSGSKSFFSGLISAEYQTDDGSGWITIFNNSLSPLTSDNTTDWKILDWTNSLFNGNNTVDLRITDQAGNILTHIYVPSVSGFNLRYDSQGPLIVSISFQGDESTLPQPSLYDWNGQDFNLSFTFNSSTNIEYIYIYSSDNPNEQLFTSSNLGWQANNPSQDLHSVTDTTVTYDIGDSGNITIFVRAQNTAGLNSSWIPGYLFVDEENPTISLQAITEVDWEWAIHPISNILYYSELMTTNFANFNVTVTPADTGSGMTDGYVRFESFGSIPIQQVADTGSFNVTAATTSGSWIRAYAVDASGRTSATENIVQVIKDNTKPTSLSFAHILEASEFLHYDGTLFYSNSHSGSESFTINVTALDSQAGLSNLTGSLEFGESLANRFDNIYSNGFSIIYYIDNGETATSIECVVYDRVGNSESITLTTDLDNSKPTNLNIFSLTEFSDYIYFDGSTLFYKNDVSMNDAFSINLTALETISGIQNVTGSLDFGEITSAIDNSTGTFDLTYTIAEGESASGGELVISVYDNVGNFETVSLTCTLDIAAPTNLVITGITESSEYLYFDGSDTLYYTNNKTGMNEQFTLHFTTTDTLSDLQKAVGSLDFGETPEDTTYTTEYSISYTVSETEVASGNDLVITVFDNVGNTALLSFTCTLDNNGPTGVVFNDILVQGGAQYLYYESNGKILYYSNDQTMMESFTVQVLANDAGSDIHKANASEFGDTESTVSYGVNGYELTFTINEGESEPTVSVTAWDNVGNPTTINLSLFEDNVNPQTLDILTVNEFSDYLYYDGSNFFFSNDQTMTDSFTIRVNGTDSGVGLKNATGEDEFNDVSVGDTSYSTYYELIYEIVQSDGVSGDAVTIELFDLVGNSATIDLLCYEDNQVPIVWLEDDAVTETSEFTYYIDDATQILWYSNQMPSSVSFDVTASTTDGIQVDDSGIRFIEFPSFFNVGSPFNVSVPVQTSTQTYSISSTSNDEGNMTFTSIDNCGNIDTTILEVRRDTQAPSGSITSINEYGSLYVHTADLNKLWYSDLMGAISQSVTIIVSSSDAGINDAGVLTVTFPEIGNEIADNRSSSRTYGLTSVDDTNGTVNFVIYDNVGNTAQISLQVTKDLQEPTILFTDVPDPDFDPSGNELDNLDNWYDQGLLTSGFDVFSNPADSLSGVFTVDYSWSSTGGDAHSGTFGSNGDGTIGSVADDNDGVITIILTVYDNVNNQFQISMIIRFDNSNPNDAGYVTDTTILHQNGASIVLSGQTDDGAGSGIQNLTITSDLFDDIVSGGFTAWNLFNSSKFDSIITPGQNETISITVFDNVNNEYSYTSYITYHTVKIVNLITTIPEHVEIDNPGSWVINFNFEVDGALIDEADKQIIDRDLDISQFNISIDGISIPLIGGIIWSGTDLTVTVDLPDSSNAQVPSIASVYSLQLDWFIDDLPANIDVALSVVEPNVVTYHDLEISYVSDYLDIVETDNPEYSLMNVIFHLEYDYAPYTGSLTDFNFNLTVDGADGTFIDSNYLGSGNHNITIQLPADLSVGSKDIDFNWRYAAGAFYYVLEFGDSSLVAPGGVVTYHDITIGATLPLSMFLFEIDGNFSFDISFLVQEENGTHSLDNTPSSLQSITIRGIDFISNLISYSDYSDGNYFFDFDLFASETDTNWLGNQTVLFRIQTPSGLWEWGEITIGGHDLQMILESLETWPVGLDFFDPDERTTFELNITVTDNNGSGPSPLPTLNLTDNFRQIYLENIQPEVNNQNATINSIVEWGYNDQGQGRYYFRFILEAQDATQLGTGAMMLILTINDTNGHVVVRSTTNDNIEFEGKDFILLLGLEWIYIEDFGNDGNFTFGFGHPEAYLGYTFRVSVNSTIQIRYRIYAAENPGEVSIESQNIYWETPWNETQSSQGPFNTTSYVTLNLTSTNVTRQRQLFVAYVEGNSEKQIASSDTTWKIFLEWDRLVAATSDVDDDEDDQYDNVTNIGSNYTLTYNSQFSSSGFNAAGSLFDINVSLWQFNGISWDLINITSLYHLDGSGDNGPIFFSNGTHVVGSLIILDNEDAPNFADGKLDFQFQFISIIKVTIQVSATEESKTSGLDYRYYPSYYPGSVYSFVNDTTHTYAEETIIWTKFDISITAADDRIPVLTGATLLLTAHYAHDSSIILTDSDVRIFVLDTNIFKVTSSTDWLGNALNFTNLLSKGIVEIVTYNISKIEDPIYGISVFQDKTVQITWDQIIFEMGFAQPWGEDTRFNVNETAFVEIVAYYDSDKTPFNGTIDLFHKETSNTSNLFKRERLWNDRVLVPISPQFTNGPGKTLFLIRGVLQDIYGLNGTREGQGYRVQSYYGDRWLLLTWDRVLVEFTEDKLEYNAGSLLNVSMSVFYESDGKLLNSSHFEYTLFKDGNEFLANRSQLFFTDFEMHTIIHTYHIEWSRDYITSLIGGFSSSLDRKPKADIEIEWIDRLAPIKIFHLLYDWGNGTIGFYVEATDDSPETYFGSGLKSVTAQLRLPGLPAGNIIDLKQVGYTNSGIKYYGEVTTDSSVERNHFLFNESVSYEIVLTDFKGNTYSESFSQYLDSDRASPLNDPVLVEFSSTIDGELTISVNASDIWSGLAGATINIKNQVTGNWSTPYMMSSRIVSNEFYEYSYNSIFDVGKFLEYQIRISDNIGNIKLIQGVLDIVDSSGPQLVSYDLVYHGFGEFSINLTSGDDGSAITNAFIFSTRGPTINLSLTEVFLGGGGSAVENVLYKYGKTFVGSFVIPTNPFEPITASFSVVLTDLEGNQRTIPLFFEKTINNELTIVESYEIPPNAIELLQNPFIFILIVVGLFGLMYVSVKRFRTVSGFDKKKIIEEILDIPDNEVWEENDNVSYGLVASFFDQTKGPVPIIVYPEKLRSSESMLATLADRSFSTLGFVSKPDEDKHATFRFQIGGEKCTVFGYAFAIANPEARGGQENLSLCFIIRSPWGSLENINKFSNELLDHMRVIREPMRGHSDIKIVQREMENTRNFLTRVMLIFRKKYRKEFVE